MKFSNTMKKLLSGLLLAAMLITMPAVSQITAQAADSSPMAQVEKGDIVILFDNDAHCAVQGYAKMKALKNEALQKTSYVTVVSSGDFIQGETLGSLSQGEAIIDVMNEVGYDVVTLGNHEFDYTVPQLKKLTVKLNAKVASCSFRTVKDDKPVFKGYVAKKYGNKKIAFVGITTPEAITKSTPIYFQNDKGEYIYTVLNDDKTGNRLYKRVQSNVNLARKNGADIVIALAHLGQSAVTPNWTSKAVMANTYGIDAVLDGHSHEEYIQIYHNKKGEKVICAQTGTKYANIGLMIIKKDGTIITDLIELSGYSKQDANVLATIQKWEDMNSELLNQKVGVNENELVGGTSEIVRGKETNLGDFCATAYQTVLEADVAIINGGGIRSDLPAGEITYRDMLKIFPFGNMACVVEATGQQIKDALENGVRNYPNGSGGFLQVAGMQYTIDAGVPSSVKSDDAGLFVSVDGEYRIKDLKIYNKATQQYEAVDLNKKYTVAGFDYILRDGGSGMSMFMNCEVVRDNVAVDVEILVQYVKDYLNGVIGSEYADPDGQGRITGINLP